MFKRAKLKDRVPIHELTAISVSLAVVGGFLDAYTYLYHGGVFANAQTGNIVLMGISLANRNFVKAAFYLVPISAFFLGILVTEFLKRRFSDEDFDNWQHISVAIELILLTVIGFLPRQVPDAIVNVTVSFVCSMQVNSFRKVKGLPYCSTMCTGNLRSATEQLSLFLFDKKPGAVIKSIRYFLVIFSFCCGAVLGTLLTGLLKGKSIFICCFLLLAVLCVILWDKIEFGFANGRQR